MTRLFQVSPDRIEPIALVRTDLTEKFGVPRQSGVVPELTGWIDFLPPYDTPEALRGLEGFSHIWLIWQFSAHAAKLREEGWSPTVRPPRLGGNERMGVFATRSPFRPNSLGLSVVKLEAVVRGGGGRGPHLLVSGVDMVDGTPIFDIKPYVPYADAVADARGGFTEGDWKKAGRGEAAESSGGRLAVEFSDDLLSRVPEEKRDALLGVLAADPRPSYQEDRERIYGLAFGTQNIRFRVEGKTVYVVDVQEKNS